LGGGGGSSSNCKLCELLPENVGTLPKKTHSVQLDSPVYIDLLNYWVLLCLKETPLAWSLDDDDDKEEEFRLHQRDLFQPIIQLFAFYASCMVFFAVMS
jgi:hypothetical protein